MAGFSRDRLRKFCRQSDLLTNTFVVVIFAACLAFIFWEA